MSGSSTSKSPDDHTLVEHSSFNDDYSEVSTSKKSQAWANFADNGASASSFKSIIMNRATLDPPLLTTTSYYSLADLATGAEPRQRRFDFDFWGSAAEELSRQFDIKSADSFENHANLVLGRRFERYVFDNLPIYDAIFADVNSSSFSWPEVPAAQPELSVVPTLLVESTSSESNTLLGMDLASFRRARRA